MLQNVFVDMESLNIKQIMKQSKSFRCSILLMSNNFKNVVIWCFGFQMSLVIFRLHSFTFPEQQMSVCHFIYLSIDYFASKQQVAFI